MAKKTKRETHLRKWLLEVLPQHDQLATAVQPLLENMLKKKKIEHLSISRRVKTLDGALEKIVRKEYENPKEQLTDLSGIRIITYLETQVDEISAVIKELFTIDSKNSRDRSEILGDDKVGYRSTHYVCSLGRQRNALPEYESIGALKFEIQIRTVLQHAWAELAHDRSFKFGASLPAKIQRKLNLYSGMLEIVDSAFDAIVAEIGEYQIQIKKGTADQFLALELNSLTLREYKSYLERKHGLKLVEMPVLDNIVAELKRFGLSTVGDLDNLVTPALIAAAKGYKLNEGMRIGSFIRGAMMFNDLEKYFSNDFSWRAIAPEFIDFLSEKCPRKRLEALLATHGIAVLGNS